MNPYRKSLIRHCEERSDEAIQCLFAIVLRGFNNFYVIASPPIAAAESALFVDGFESLP